MSRLQLVVGAEEEEEEEGGHNNKKSRNLERECIFLLV
jgi:hypothetical protein